MRQDTRTRNGRSAGGRLALVLALLAMLLGGAARVEAALSASPASVRVVAGTNSGSIQLVVSGAANDTIEPRNLGVTGLPPGATAVPASPVVTFTSESSGTAAFTLATAPTTPPGTYPVQVGQADFGIGFTSVMLVVPAPSVTVVPSSVALVAGAGSPPLTVTVQDLLGAQLRFEPEIPPVLAGRVTVAPSPPTVSIPPGATSGSAPFTLAVAASAPAGSHSIPFTDRGRGLGFTVMLRVEAAAPPPPPPPPPVLALRVAASPETLRLVPGTASETVRLHLTGTGGGGRRLSFRAQAPAGLGVLPDPVALTIPAGGPPVSTSFRVEAAAGLPPGQYTVLLREASLGLETQVRVTVEALRAEVRLSPARLRLTAGSTSPPVSLVVADGNLGGRTVVFTAPGAAAGLALVPAAVPVAVPAAGGAASASFRVAAGPAVEPGLYALRLEAPLAGGPPLSAVLEVEVESGVELDRVVPARVARGALEVPVRLQGRGFQPGARLEADGLLRFAPLRVLSPELAETRLSVRADAPAGGYAVDLVNPDGSRSRQPVLVAVVDGDSLAAPLAVRGVAVVHPLPGALLARDEALLPRGVVATAGTGTLVGSWRLDGVPFDRFVVLARAGEPVPVEARRPVPPSFPGSHRLELVVESPQEVASPPVELVVVERRVTGLRTYAPARGEVVAPGDLRFRWSLVPGALGYQVEVERDGGRPPLVVRTPEAGWQPGAKAAADLGPGLHRWRVRPVLAGGALGEATERRRFALLPERVELRALPVSGATGELVLAWEGGAPGLVYRVELSGSDGGGVFSALVAEGPYEVPPEAPPFARWRVVALGPGGVVLGASPWKETGLAAMRGGRRGGYRLASAVASATVDLTTVVPAHGAEVATAFPRLEARWEPAVDPETVSLVIGDLDVTALAVIGPDSLVYESLLPLEPGLHAVRLRLGGREAGWSFRTTVAAGAAADGGSGSDPHAGDRSADPAWIDEAPRVAPAQAAAGGPLPAGDGTAPASIGSWRLGAEGTVSRLAADGQEDRDDGVLSLSAQVDRQAGGVGVQATADLARTETLSGSAPHQESRSWVATAGRQGERSRQAATVGYAGPDFLFGSELAGGGLPRGGGQATFGAGPVSAAAFRTFDPDLGTAGGRVETLDVEAGSLAWTGGPGLQVRAFGLRTDESASDFVPGGEGELLGLLATWMGASGTSLSVEGARGDHTPGPGSFEEARFGHAFRLAAAGSRQALGWGLALHFTEDGFVNPADRGFSPGGVADRSGATLSLSRGFGTGGSVRVEVRHLRGGMDSGLEARDARQTGGRLDLSTPLGESVRLTLGANLVDTRGGGDDGLGLPAAQRVDRGATLSLQETVGRVVFTQSLSWQEGKDDAQPDLANEVLSAGLSAAATLGTGFSLFAQLDGLRNEQAGFFGGTTDSFLASLQPTWTLAAAGLTVQTYLAFNRVETVPASDLFGAGGAQESETYRLTVSWAPPRVGSFLALQGGGEWTRSRVPGVEDEGFGARYTLGVTLRWDAASVGVESY